MKHLTKKTKNRIEAAFENVRLKKFHFPVRKHQFNATQWRTVVRYIQHSLVKLAISTTNTSDGFNVDSCMDHFNLRRSYFVKVWLEGTARSEFDVSWRDFYPISVGTGRRMDASGIRLVRECRKPAHPSRTTDCRLDAICRRMRGSASDHGRVWLPSLHYGASTLQACLSGRRAVAAITSWLDAPWTGWRKVFLARS